MGKWLSKLQTDDDKNRIRRWLVSVGESDPEVIHDVMDLCAEGPQAGEGRNRNQVQRWNRGNRSRSGRRMIHSLNIRFDYNSVPRKRPRYTKFEMVMVSLLPSFPSPDVMWSLVIGQPAAEL